MTRIEIAGRDFWRILKACANACDKSNFRSVLRYIELRAEGTECIATSLDGFIMQQIRVRCNGSGTVLIPCGIQPPKCKSVVIEDMYGLKITYLDFCGKLIYAHEFPRCNDGYFDWGKIVETGSEEHTIYCNALNLRKALDAAVYAEDQTISINIPEDKLKPIRIASMDVQMLVLPVRIGSERDEASRKFKNWRKQGGNT